MTIKKIWIVGILFLGIPFSLRCQSIEEKKANLKSFESDLDQETESFLLKINKETQEIHTRLEQLYAEVFRLYQADAHPMEYRALLDQINTQKEYLAHLENTWRELVARGNRNAEGYGLWHAPETTLEQLIIDYGSQDYVYLIPQEVGSIKLSIDSNLPIPRASWSEMLELILAENGVGVRTLNPYLRQLYLVKQSNAHLKLMTKNRKDLEVLPPATRISFFLSPEPSEVRRTFNFLERFINPKTTSIQVLGRDILLIGPSGDVQDLLRLYDFIAVNRGEKEYRLLPVYKLPADEMARILGAIFDHGEASDVITSSGPPGTEGSPPSPPRPPSSSISDVNGLKIIVLENMAQALFVIGTREEVRKAEEIVRNVESSIGGARDKVAFWYTVKHSDAEELADVLYRVYSLMISSGTSFDGQPGLPGEGPPGRGPDGGPVPPPIQDGSYQDGTGFFVNPPPAIPRSFEPTIANADRDNFIVDVKTGSIVMVVEADIVPKIKDLLRKLDVPKKMIQIETLLFEKILNRENNIGLNLLRFGDAAMNSHKTGVFFNNLFPKGNRGDREGRNAGIFEFFISRKETDCGIPAFDLAYRFLLNQDDVQINSNPSLLTINQTPATIAINEEISLNTGVFEVEKGRDFAVRDAFTRAQYGITISIKPTIHLTQCEEEDLEYDYVTLETDITFDTIQPGGNSDRPNVTRRHITNQVQVPDGETVILGGLRRKVSHDAREAIPFLGELPGLGKLFSINKLRDSNTEMFIFITPHIVKDPKEQLACLRQELLCLRPGDVPYFLECVEEAHRYEKTRLMEGSMTMLFGRPNERYYVQDDCSSPSCGIENSREYDGR